MKKPEEERVIKHQDKQPCGCLLTEYSDGSKVLAPCVPCGLNHVAQYIAKAAAELSQAAQALSATAMTIRTQQSIASLKQILR